MARDWEVKRASYEESVRSKQAQAKQLSLRLACDICGEKAKLNCPCGTTQYCSVACQRVDWRDRGHRTACKKIRDERAAETARAEAPTPPPEEVFYGPAPRSGADEVRARIAAEHEAARARREANPEPKPMHGERYGGRCPVCYEDWDVNATTRIRKCCCRKICRACDDKVGYNPCPLCRAPASKSDAEDLARLRRHVDNELPEALLYLGNAYKTGEFGLVASMKKAAKLLKRAAELGNANAMSNLAAQYLAGEGVKKDQKKATQLIRKAAEQGFPPAQCTAGMECEADGNFRDAFAYYKLAADQGFTQAEVFLGMAYCRGQGVEKNVEEAMRLLLRAAEKGNEVAMSVLRGIHAQLRTT